MKLFLTAWLAALSLLGIFIIDNNRPATIEQLADLPLEELMELDFSYTFKEKYSRTQLIIQECESEIQAKAILKTLVINPHNWEYIK